MPGELYVDETVVPPLRQMAELGLNLALGIWDRETALSRTAEALMSLRCDTELINTRFTQLAASDAELLPGVIGIVAEGVLSHRDSDETSSPIVPATPEAAISTAHKGVFGDDGMEEAWTSAKLLRVFLIGLEKGGFDRRTAERHARKELCEALKESVGSDTYGAVAEIRYLNRVMDMAHLHNTRTTAVLLGRAVWYARNYGAEIV